MNKLIYPELSYAVQGSFYDVYNELRDQELSEAGWEKALSIALADKGIPAERQVEWELHYKGYRIGRFFLDVVVDEKLLLELKATDALLPINETQIIAYLKITRFKLGILVNFGKLTRNSDVSLTSSASGLSTIRQVRVSGGGARSLLWRQILADIGNVSAMAAK